LQKTLHNHRQRTMAPHQRNTQIHQTTPRNKNILQQTTTHKRTKKSTKKKYFYPRNMPLLMLHTINEKNVSGL
jgi:hypothetical protein